MFSSLLQFFVANCESNLVDLRQFLRRQDYESIWPLVFSVLFQSLVSSVVLAWPGDVLLNFVRNVVSYKIVQILKTSEDAEILIKTLDLIMVIRSSSVVFIFTRFECSVHLHSFRV